MEKHCKIKTILLLTAINLLTLTSFSQGEFNKWFFGTHVGLDFNSGFPICISNPNSVGGGQYSVSVSDSLGNLLFYAGSWCVFNRNHDIMPNGWGLLGNPSGWDTFQPVLAVQKTDDDSSYFLFTMGQNEFPNFDEAPLTYSIIDMRLDGGLGDIPFGQKNLNVAGAENSTGALTGARHHNNRDVWVVVRELSTKRGRE